MVLAAIHTPICDFGLPAPDFELPGIDGRMWSRADCLGTRGLLVMFICNHCPYVRAITRKLVRDCTALIKIDIGCVAIMPNDTQTYPEDDLQHMQVMAKEQRYPFPYLIDESQHVARQFGAVCTPDFFGYNAGLELQYRGRLDAAGARRDMEDAPRELYLAMKDVAEQGKGPVEQLPSMGCSIKWRVSGG
jgi:peroxiredoxin